MRDCEGLVFDVMLEAKAKDLSLLKLRPDLLRYAPDVAARFGILPVDARLHSKLKRRPLRLRIQRWWTRRSGGPNTGSAYAFLRGVQRPALSRGTDGSPRRLLTPRVISDAGHADATEGVASSAR